MNKIDALLEELQAAIRNGDKAQETVVRAELDRLTSLEKETR